MSVLNEGVTGNRVLNDSPCFGVKVGARLDRDVLARRGVAAVIFTQGTNDFAFPIVPVEELGLPPECFQPGTEVSPEDVIEGMRQVIARVHAVGIPIFGATLNPIKGGYEWSPETEVKRKALNTWIRGAESLTASSTSPRRSPTLAIRTPSLPGSTAATTSIRTTTATPPWRTRSTSDFSDKEGTMRHRWFPGLVGAALLVFISCKDGGPTSPTEPRPTEPTSALGGEWHGTMSYAGGTCVSEEVDATASPEGSRVRLNVRSLCHGSVVFLLEEQPLAVSGSAELHYDGSCDSIFGQVSRPSLRANVSGTIDGGRLHLETTSFTMPIVNCSRPAVTLELVR